MNHTTQIPGPDASRCISLTYLETNAFGHSDFVLHSIDILLEQMPELFDKLQEGLAEQDWQAIATAAHKLKASAGMLGMRPLNEQLCTLELSASVGLHTDRLPGLVEHVMEVVGRAIEELKLERRNYA